MAYDTTKVRIMISAMGVPSMDFPILGGVMVRSVGMTASE
jgi:hypothetical protein